LLQSALSVQHPVGEERQAPQAVVVSHSPSHAAEPLLLDDELDEVLPDELLDELLDDVLPDELDELELLLDELDDAWPPLPPIPVSPCAQALATRPSTARLPDNTIHASGLLTSFMRAPSIATCAGIKSGRAGLR
jgi:hypothetical protein